MSTGLKAKRFFVLDNECAGKLPFPDFRSSGNHGWRCKLSVNCVQSFFDFVGREPVQKERILARATGAPAVARQGLAIR